MPTLISVLLLTALSSMALVYVEGPRVATFFSNIDDSDQPYGLYLPKGYNPAKAYPLVVSLHGSGSNHRLNLRRVFGQGNRPGETDPQATRYFPTLPDVDFIVASPYARGSFGYAGIAEQDVLDMMADVKRRFRIDEDRVYLTGLSMGGGGTLWLGLTRPDLWAAIAPVCAGGREAILDRAANAHNLAVHLFHGDADPTVPVERSREWYKEFQRLGIRSQYVEYPGVKHNSWDHAYKDAAIFSWFAQHRRNRLPERVRYATREYKHRSAYWVELDAFTPGTLASIDARRTGPNRVDVETRDLEGFTLKLAGPLTVSIDGSTVEAPAGGASFVKSGGAWKTGRYGFRAGEKRPGAEGPIAEAIASRHLYVYGTADSPDAAELKRRERVALAAADWIGSRPQMRLSVSLYAAPDKDVPRNQDLVVFGTKETNRVLRAYAGRLPLQLKASAAAEYGLVFVAHVDGRYLLVNSGLPWSTDLDHVSMPGARRPLYAPNHVLHTMNLPDYVLFKGSMANIVAQGRFNRDWTVPAADAQKLAATGAVTVRDIFAKDNLLAWCVVPFDAKKRGPEERAEMLRRLGFRRFAYDWRAEHIPEFDREIDALAKHGIELTAFWMPSGLDPASDKNIRAILDVLKRRQVKTQLWLYISAEKPLAPLDQAQKVEAAAKVVTWVAEEAKKIGCSVALYNHNGWSGEPENQIAIIRRVNMDNVGIVYNFNHAHGQIERFPALWPQMLPYLKALTLNGMKKDGPMILPIGAGDSELEMLRIVARSGYRGPVGVLAHRAEMDAEEALKLNLDGLEKLRGRL